MTAADQEYRDSFSFQPVLKQKSWVCNWRKVSLKTHSWSTFICKSNEITVLNCDSDQREMNHSTVELNVNMLLFSTYNTDGVLRLCIVVSHQCNRKLSWQRWWQWLSNFLYFDDFLHLQKHSVSHVIWFSCQSLFSLQHCWSLVQSCMLQWLPSAKAQL